VAWLPFVPYPFSSKQAHGLQKFRPAQGKSKHVGNTYPLGVGLREGTLYPCSGREAETKAQASFHEHQSGRWCQISV